MLMVPEAGAREQAAGREAEVLAASFDVSLAFRGKPVIEHVSVAVHPSEIVTLIGPNGAGKTTLAKMLLGLVTPSSGKVARREGLRVGYVPQRFVADWIIPLSVRRFMSLTQSISKARALECLGETGAAHLLDAQMAELSGGEFQRVALARALARDPHLLVLDEPAQAVDFAGAAKLYELIAGHPPAARLRHPADLPRPAGGAGRERPRGLPQPAHLLRGRAGGGGWASGICAAVRAGSGARLRALPAPPRSHAYALRRGLLPRAGRRQLALETKCLASGS